MSQRNYTLTDTQVKAFCEKIYRVLDEISLEDHECPIREIDIFLPLKTPLHSVKAFTFPFKTYGIVTVAAGFFDNPNDKSFVYLGMEHIGKSVFVNYYYYNEYFRGNTGDIGEKIWNVFEETSAVRERLLARQEDQKRVMLDNIFNEILEKV